MRPIPQRDEYLRELIRVCHRNAILVYAWLELPHVSERFWQDHPEWREKTAVLQDAHLDWRKLMNLTNRDCFRAASAGIAALIGRFEWDGVNLAELYFESLEGAANPSRFTPMNADVRADFRAQAGFDPVDLFAGGHAAARCAPPSLVPRLPCHPRQPHAGRMDRRNGNRAPRQTRSRHGPHPRGRPLRHRHARPHRRRRRARAPLLDKHEFTFMVEDPATVWHLGPQRYPEIARRYQPLTPRTGKLAIDINIVERYQDVYPTKQQTGTELFQLLSLASRAFPRVMLYFENSILAPDVPLLAAAMSAVTRVERMGPRLTVESKYRRRRAVGTVWRWSTANPGPPRTANWSGCRPACNRIEPAPPAAGNAGLPARLVDFNGELKSAAVLPAAAYNSPIAPFPRHRGPRPQTRPPADRLRRRSARDSSTAAGPFVIALPRGQHLVELFFE